MKELIKTIIKDFHKRGLPEFVERDISIPLNSGKIVSIIGPRRAGKTYLMFQVISKIREITNAVYINFEDERLKIGAKDFNLIIEAYFELYPDKKEKDIFFFFDEIQEIRGWEQFVRRIYDTITRNVFITGSSAKLLSREIATSLRGRTISYEVLPLSFKEYIRFKGVEEDIYSTKGKSKLISVFNEYMIKGGFPEIISMTKEISEKTLHNYFEVMLYKDIAERYSINNILPVKLFLKRLLGNASKEFTINKIFNDMKSEGIKVSKDSMYKYMEYCEDAYALIVVNNFDESATKQIIKKSYSIDTGLSLILSFALSKDNGRILENIILLELKRRNKKVFYYKGNAECDFILKKRDKITDAIQVCYDLNKENQKREINGLKNAMSRFNLKKGIIITCNEEKKAGDIEVVPAFKWLLKNED